uniref:Uncharacterized protein n=1 Tax=Opuntia streptacantha TaxID=393608 RepID=A0A7C9D5V6_OPUST
MEGFLELLEMMVSLCQDLLGELKEKAKSSSSASMPRSDRQTTEASISRISGQSDTGQAQSTGLCQPFDNVEHFEHKNNEIIGNGPTSASQILGSESGASCLSH